MMKGDRNIPLSKRTKTFSQLVNDIIDENQNLVFKERNRIRVPADSDPRY